MSEPIPFFHSSDVRLAIALAYAQAAKSMGLGEYCFGQVDWNEESIGIYEGSDEHSLMFSIDLSEDRSKYTLTSYRMTSVDKVIAEAPTTYFHLILSKWFDIILKDTVENVHQGIALAETHEVNPAEESY